MKNTNPFFIASSSERRAIGPLGLRLLQPPGDGTNRKGTEWERME